MTLKTIPLFYSIRNLWTRRLTTFLTAGGISLVVFVFSAVLMLAHGLEKTLVSTGSDENALIIRRGAETEIMSMIDRDQVNIIKSLSGEDQAGKPLATAEVLVLINLPKRGNNNPSNLQIRGISPQSIRLRDEFKLVAGRELQPGSSEIMVGTAASQRFQGIGLGETVRFGMRDWKVVGVFETGGSGFESEIWLDAEQLIQAFRRPIFSSVTVRLSGPNTFSQIKEKLETDPRFNVEVKNERQYYTDQSKMLATFIRVLGIFVTLIFSLGAMIGAMITMYTAVANRTVEIGTLRALGFSRKSILLAFLVESILLSVIGGAIGLLLASFLQTMTVSTTNFATFSEVAFRFTLSPTIVMQTMVFSLIMGMLGGFLPSFKAARQNIVQSLRTL